MPDLNFTDFYPLWRLSDVVATGTFNSHWNGSYDRITLKSKAYWYPQHGGCGQKIPSFKLKPTPALPGPIASIETLGNGVVYVLCSTIYPILYVGITDKGLRKGIFGGGRFAHHMRKLYASHASSTSHTAGWPAHAIARYRDRVRIYAEPAQQTTPNGGTLIGGDLVMAFASANTPWNPKSHEGTVLDSIRDANAWGDLQVEILNTAGISREPANILVPNNLAQIAEQVRECQALPDDQRLLRLRTTERIFS